MDKIDKLSEFMSDSEMMEVILNSQEVADMELKKVIATLINDGVSSELIWDYINSFNTDEDE